MGAKGGLIGKSVLAVLFAMALALALCSCSLREPERESGYRIDEEASYYNRDHTTRDDAVGEFTESITNLRQYLDSESFVDSGYYMGVDFDIDILDAEENTVGNFALRVQAYLYTFPYEDKQGNPIYKYYENGKFYDENNEAGTRKLVSGLEIHNEVIKKSDISIEWYDGATNQTLIGLYYDGLNSNADNPGNVLYANVQGYKRSFPDFGDTVLYQQLIRLLVHLSVEGLLNSLGLSGDAGVGAINRTMSSLVGEENYKRVVNGELISLLFYALSLDVVAGNVNDLVWKLFGVFGRKWDPMTRKFLGFMFSTVANSEIQTINGDMRATISPDRSGLTNVLTNAEFAFSGTVNSAESTPYRYSMGMKFDYAWSYPESLELDTEHYQPFEYGKYEFDGLLYVPAWDAMFDAEIKTDMQQYDNAANNVLVEFRDIANGELMIGIYYREERLWVDISGMAYMYGWVDLEYLGFPQVYDERVDLADLLGKLSRGINGIIVSIVDSIVDPTKSDKENSALKRIMDKTSYTLKDPADIFSKNTETLQIDIELVKQMLEETGQGTYSTRQIINILDSLSPYTMDQLAMMLGIASAEIMLEKTYFTLTWDVDKQEFTVIMYTNVGVKPGDPSTMMFRLDLVPIHFGEYVKIQRIDFSNFKPLGKILTYSGTLEGNFVFSSQETVDLSKLLSATVGESSGLNTPYRLASDAGLTFVMTYDQIVSDHYFEDRLRKSGRSAFELKAWLTGDESRSDETMVIGLASDDVCFDNKVYKDLPAREAELGYVWVDIACVRKDGAQAIPRVKIREDVFMASMSAYMNNETSIADDVSSFADNDFNLSLTSIVSALCKDAYVIPAAEQMEITSSNDTLQRLFRVRGLIGNIRVNAGFCDRVKGLQGSKDKYYMYQVGRFENILGATHPYETKLRDRLPVFFYADYREKYDPLKFDFFVLPETVILEGAGETGSRTVGAGTLFAYRLGAKRTAEREKIEYRATSFFAREGENNQDIRKIKFNVDALILDPDRMSPDNPDEIDMSPANRLVFEQEGKYCYRDHFGRRKQIPKKYIELGTDEDPTVYVHWLGITEVLFHESDGQFVFYDENRAIPDADGSPVSIGATEERKLLFEHDAESIRITESCKTQYAPRTNGSFMGETRRYFVTFDSKDDGNLGRIDDLHYDESSEFPPYFSNEDRDYVKREYDDDGVLVSERKMPIRLCVLEPCEPLPTEIDVNVVAHETRPRKRFAGEYVIDWPAASSDKKGAMALTEAVVAPGMMGETRFPVRIVVLNREIEAAERVSVYERGIRSAGSFAERPDDWSKKAGATDMTKSDAYYVPASGGFKPAERFEADVEYFSEQVFLTDLAPVVDEIEIDPYEYVLQKYAWLKDVENFNPASFSSSIEYLEREYGKKAKECAERYFARFPFEIDFDWRRSNLYARGIARASCSTVSDGRETEKTAELIQKRHENADEGGNVLTPQAWSFDQSPEGTNAESAISPKGSVIYLHSRFKGQTVALKVRIGRREYRRLKFGESDGFDPEARNRDRESGEPRITGKYVGNAYDSATYEIDRRPTFEFGDGTTSETREYRFDMPVAVGLKRDSDGAYSGTYLEEESFGLSWGNPRIENVTSGGSAYPEYAYEALRVAGDGDECFEPVGRNWADGDEASTALVLSRKGKYDAETRARRKEICSGLFGPEFESVVEAAWAGLSDEEKALEVPVLERKGKYRAIGGAAHRRKRLTREALKSIVGDPAGIGEAFDVEYGSGKAPKLDVDRRGRAIARLTDDESERVPINRPFYYFYEKSDPERAPVLLDRETHEAFYAEGEEGDAARAKYGLDSTEDGARTGALFDLSDALRLYFTSTGRDLWAIDVASNAIVELDERGFGEIEPGLSGFAPIELRIEAECPKLDPVEVDEEITDGISGATHSLGNEPIHGVITRKNGAPGHCEIDPLDGETLFFPDEITVQFEYGGEIGEHKFAGVEWCAGRDGGGMPEFERNGVELVAEMSDAHKANEFRVLRLAYDDLDAETRGKTVVALDPSSGELSELPLYAKDAETGRAKIREIFSYAELSAAFEATHRADDALDAYATFESEIYAENEHEPVPEEERARLTDEEKAMTVPTLIEETLLVESRPLYSNGATRRRARRAIYSETGRETVSAEERARLTDEEKAVTVPTLIDETLLIERRPLYSNGATERRALADMRALTAKERARVAKVRLGGEAQGCAERPLHSSDAQNRAKRLRYDERTIERGIFSDGFAPLRTKYADLTSEDKNAEVRVYDRKRRATRPGKLFVKDPETGRALVREPETLAESGLRKRYMSAVDIDAHPDGFSFVVSARIGNATSGYADLRVVADILSKNPTDAKFYVGDAENGYVEIATERVATRVSAEKYAEVAASETEPRPGVAYYAKIGGERAPAIAGKYVDEKATPLPGFPAGYFVRAGEGFAPAAPTASEPTPGEEYRIRIGEAYAPAIAGKYESASATPLPGFPAGYSTREERAEKTAYYEYFANTFEKFELPNRLVVTFGARTSEYENVAWRPASGGETRPFAPNAVQMLVTTIGAPGGANADIFLHAICENFRVTGMRDRSEYADKDNPILVTAETANGKPLRDADGGIRRAKVADMFVWNEGLRSIECVFVDENNEKYYPRIAKGDPELDDDRTRLCDIGLYVEGKAGATFRKSVGPHEFLSKFFDRADIELGKYGLELSAREKVKIGYRGAGGIKMLEATDDAAEIEYGRELSEQKDAEGRALREDVMTVRLKSRVDAGDELAPDVDGNGMYLIDECDGFGPRRAPASELASALLTRDMQKNYADFVLAKTRGVPVDAETRVENLVERDETTGELRFKDPLAELEPKDVATLRDGAGAERDIEIGELRRRLRRRQALSCPDAVGRDDPNFRPIRLANRRIGIKDLERCLDINDLVIASGERPPLGRYKIELGTGAGAYDVTPEIRFAGGLFLAEADRVEKRERVEIYDEKGTALYERGYDPGREIEVRNARGVDKSGAGDRLFSYNCGAQGEEKLKWRVAGEPENIRFGPDGVVPASEAYKTGAAKSASVTALTREGFRLKRKIVFELVPETIEFGAGDPKASVAKTGKFAAVPIADEKTGRIVVENVYEFVRDAQDPMASLREYFGTTDWLPDRVRIELGENEYASEPHIGADGAPMPYDELAAEEKARVSADGAPEFEKDPETGYALRRRPVGRRAITVTDPDWRLTEEWTNALLGRSARRITCAGTGPAKMATAQILGYGRTGSKAECGVEIALEILIESTKVEILPWSDAPEIMLETLTRNEGGKLKFRVSIDPIGDADALGKSIFVDEERGGRRYFRPPADMPVRYDTGKEFEFRNAKYKYGDRDVEKVYFDMGGIDVAAMTSEYGDLRGLTAAPGAFDRASLELKILLGLDQELSLEVRVCDKTPKSATPTQYAPLTQYASLTQYAPFIRDGATEPAQYSSLSDEEKGETAFGMPKYREAEDGSALVVGLTEYSSLTDEEKGETAFGMPKYREAGDGSAEAIVLTEYSSLSADEREEKAFGRPKYSEAEDGTALVIVPMATHYAPLIPDGATEPTQYSSLSAEEKGETAFGMPKYREAGDGSAEVATATTRADAIPVMRSDDETLRVIVGAERKDAVAARRKKLIDGINFKRLEANLAGLADAMGEILPEIRAIFARASEEYETEVGQIRTLDGIKATLRWREREGIDAIRPCAGIPPYPETTAFSPDQCHNFALERLVAASLAAEDECARAVAQALDASGATAQKARRVAKLLTEHCERIAKDGYNSAVEHCVEREFDRLFLEEFRKADAEALNGATKYKNAIFDGFDAAGLEHELRRVRALRDSETPIELALKQIDVGLFDAYERTETGYARVADRRYDFGKAYCSLAATEARGAFPVEGQAYEKTETGYELTADPEPEPGKAYWALAPTEYSLPDAPDPYFALARAVVARFALDACEFADDRYAVRDSGFRRIRRAVREAFEARLDLSGSGADGANRLYVAETLIDEAFASEPALVGAKALTAYALNMAFEATNFVDLDRDGRLWKGFAALALGPEGGIAQNAYKSIRNYSQTINAIRRDLVSGMSISSIVRQLASDGIDGFLDGPAFESECREEATRLLETAGALLGADRYPGYPDAIAFDADRFMLLLAENEGKYSIDPYSAYRIEPSRAMLFFDESGPGGADGAGRASVLGLTIAKNLPAELVAPRGGSAPIEAEITSPVTGETRAISIQGIVVGRVEAEPKEIAHRLMIDALRKFGKNPYGLTEADASDGRLRMFLDEDGKTVRYRDRDTGALERALRFVRIESESDEFGGMRATEFDRIDESGLLAYRLKNLRGADGTLRDQTLYVFNPFKFDVAEDFPSVVTIGARLREIRWKNASVTPEGNLAAARRDPDAGVEGRIESDAGEEVRLKLRVARWEYAGTYVPTDEETDMTRVVSGAETHFKWKSPLDVYFSPYLPHSAEDCYLLAFAAKIFVDSPEAREERFVLAPAPEGEDPDFAPVEEGFVTHLFYPEDSRLLEYGTDDSTMEEVRKRALYTLFWDGVARNEVISLRRARKPNCNIYVGRDGGARHDLARLARVGDGRAQTRATYCCEKMYVDRVRFDRLDPPKAEATEADGETRVEITDPARGIRLALTIPSSGPATCACEVCGAECSATEAGGTYDLRCERCGARVAYDALTESARADDRAAAIYADIEPGLLGRDAFAPIIAAPDRNLPQTCDVVLTQRYVRYRPEELTVRLLWRKSLEELLPGLKEFVAATYPELEKAAVESYAKNLVMTWPERSRAERDEIERKAEEYFAAKEKRRGEDYVRRHKAEFANDLLAVNERYDYSAERARRLRGGADGGAKVRILIRHAGSDEIYEQEFTVKTVFADYSPLGYFLKDSGGNLAPAPDASAWENRESLKNFRPELYIAVRKAYWCDADAATGAPAENAYRREGTGGDGPYDDIGDERYKHLELFGQTNRFDASGALRETIELGGRELYLVKLEGIEWTRDPSAAEGADEFYAVSKSFKLGGVRYESDMLRLKVKIVDPSS